MKPQGPILPMGGGRERALLAYTIENLGRRKYGGSELVVEKPRETRELFTVNKFYFLSDGKKVTGLAHIPKSCSGDNKCPVIVQFRGYVDVEKYQPGVGTRKSAEVFAKNGYVSLAPDFLGYGGSASPSADVFEARFETYITAANLLAAIEKWQMSNGRIGMWGHSNGGQIALTVLEILGKPIPASLWAPVSKPFPYSILYYTDEADDRGKAMRKKLAEFEDDYDADLFSLSNYLDRVQAPLVVHQGSEDEAVPRKWSDELVEELRKEEKDVTYYVYPGADHNMNGAWNVVMDRDIKFFRKYGVF